MPNQYWETAAKDFSEALKEALGITLIDPLQLDCCSYPMVTLAFYGQAYAANGGDRYNTVDSDGNPHVYEFDYYETMPIQPDLRILIATEEVPQLIKIEDFVTKMYSEPRNLFVAHPSIEGETLPFQVELDTSKEIERTPLDKNGKQVYSSFIRLKCSQGVLFYETPHPAELAFDEKLKIDLLQRIAIIGDGWRRLGSAIETFDEKYKDADLQDATVRETIAQTENRYSVVPQLAKYPEMRTGRELCVQLAADYAALWKAYRRLLEETKILPEEFWSEDRTYWVHRAAYIQRKDKCDVATAAQRAKEKEEELAQFFPGIIDKVIAEQEREEQRRRAAQAQAQAQSGPAGGSSSIGRELFSALGEALSESAAKKKAKEEERRQKERARSLWGTAMCPYGKKDEDGWTIYCNMGCPLWTECGGKPRKY